MASAATKQYRLTAVFSTVLLLLILNGWFLYFNFHNVSEQEDLTEHAAKVVSELELVLSAAKDAETGLRGFLLTNQIEYLEPYQSGRRHAVDHLANVRSLVSGNLKQVAALDEISKTLDNRFAILESVRTKFVANNGKIAGSDIKFSEGKFAMDTLRSQVAAMQQAERAVLHERSRQSDQSKTFFIWSLIFTTLILAIVISIAFTQMIRNQHRTSQEALAQAAEAREKQLIADVSQIVAGDASVETIGEELLEFFSKKFGILASKLLVFDRGKLITAAAYGIQESTLMGPHNVEANTTAGLVTATMNRRTPWQINDVPSSYWRISSALGSAVPSSLTMIPLLFQGRDLGVIELGSFEAIPSNQIALMDRMTETIAIGLSAAQSRASLQALLERTQQQSEELQAQQEELRTNNEELEQQARALESQQQVVSAKNRELETTQTELEEKARDLERSSQYKSEFLAKMSHELRTPLNGLMILSTLLIENKEKNLTEQQRQFARSINSAGNDLLTLINDILDLSKIEARKLTLRPETFTLGSLFASKRRTFEPQTSSKGLELVTELPAELSELRLHTDRQRLEQILRNFMSNAIKFTEKGSITLTASHDPAKNTIKITATDTGIGIPKEKQGLIFEAFEQADSSVSRKYGGTGLGLTISRELAALLGGEISLESEEGKGSRFSVEIPVELSAEAQRAASPLASGASAPELSRGGGSVLGSTSALGASAAEKAPLQGMQDTPLISSDRIQRQARETLRSIPKDKKTILVVEDDHKFRASVVETIRSYNFEAIEAADGEVALAILNEHTPDAILLDIKLPGISGLGILEMIKQLPQLRHIPVHMISALEYQRNALRMGALGYLTKPVTMEKVKSALNRIENLLSRKLRRVLLIEDDERQNDAIAHLIAGADIEVIPAKTGKHAIELLKDESFDCIILDLTLPDVSGFDLLAELSSLNVSLPPVVIYTGKDLTDAEESYLRRYSESIVLKGARSPERLLDEVNLFLHRVESLLPEEKRQMLSTLRSQDRALEGKTVLLVDDDIRNVFALTSALEAKGLHVRVARNGVEAIDSLDENKDIDLVLMDIMMPKMDGFEAMRRIRSNPDQRLRDVPIVALTAKAMKEDHERCMDAGANDYIPKPINLDNLSTVLKVWLAPRGALA